MQGAAGAGSKSTYVDDVFSTYLYKGAGATNTITNNIDLTEGGLVWVKRRDGTYMHGLYDTVRGVNKRLSSDRNDPEVINNVSPGITGFTATGFTTGDANDVNGNNDTYASWTFRKQKGFFDIVTYTGDGTASKTINHSLGSIPGVIIAKRTDNYGTWVVYHKNLGNDKILYLDWDDAVTENADQFDKTDPTASSFTVEYTGSGGSDLNVDGATYIAYLFAGGESTAATARSVDFDGSGDYLTVAGPGALGTSTDFTMECWVYLDNLSGYQRIFSANEGANSDEATQIRTDGTNWNVYLGRNGSSDYWTFNGGNPVVRQWTHLALVRNGSNNAFYVNGVLQASSTGSHDTTITTLVVGGGYGSENLDGKVSNARFVNGTAVYTSSFTPPTEPLTSITNTSLLCCNNSSTTGKTTGGTITAHGDPTASTDSPFDDPEGYKFGEEGDQNVIKCGSLKMDSNGNATVDLGWEPQWILLRKAYEANNWSIYDKMRGILTGYGDQLLSANTTSAETQTGTDIISVTSTGFKLSISSHSNDTYIYMAIRSVDGYVGKPAEAGTDVFAMDTGAGSSTIPNFDSGFPVDFAFSRDIDTVDNWYTFARPTGPGFLYMQGNGTESDSNDWAWDSNVGWQKAASWGSDKQSWMFKRGQGFDVLTWDGSGANRFMPHSMNKKPEMMIVKSRATSGRNWMTYHKGMNGGINPEDYYMDLNQNGQNWTESGTLWNDTQPTSTGISLGTSAGVNGSGETYLGLLFASVDGISQCGYYDGSNSEITITFDNGGFSPRFVIIKRTESSGDWITLDTRRGWGTTGPVNDCTLALNTNTVQYCSTYDWGSPTSTGMRLGGGSGYTNTAGGKYIYYAHA